MKKKIIAFCLLITMLCTFLIGCGLVDTNTEKDLQRVIVSVGNPDVYQDEIKKYELVNYYATVNGQAQQQGYGATQSMEDLLKQMVDSRITIQVALTYLLKYFNESEISEYIRKNGFTYYEILGRHPDNYNKDNVGTDDEYKNYDYGDGAVTINIKQGDLTLKDVLAPAEGEPKTSQLLTMLLRCYYGDFSATKLAAISGYTFKEYYEAIKDSSVFSDHLIISALNSVWGSEKSNLDTIENRLRDESGLDPIEEESSNNANTRPVPKKDKEDRFVLPNANTVIDADNIDDLRTKAFNEYKNQIKKNFFGMSYSEFFEKQLVSELEQKVIERYRELVIEDYKVEVDEFKERFNAIKNSEEQGFNLDLNSYKTKLESLGDNDFILYNPDAGIYGYVKHILLGLDTDLNKGLQIKLDVLKAQEWQSRGAYLSSRNSILLAETRIKDLREDVKQDDDRFPGYDPYGTGDSISDTDPKSLLDFYDMFITKFGGGDGSVEPNKIYKANNSNTLLDEFEKWIYMYNTDTGIFGKDKGYLISERNSMNSNETYMVEFANAARDLIDDGHGIIGSYTLVATDYGYHLIMLTDIISGDGVTLENALALYDTIVKGKETEADKKEAAYKLYQIIKNQRGQEKYSKDIADAIKKYDTDGFCVFYKSRYQDLLEV